MILAWLACVQPPDDVGAPVVLGAPVRLRDGDADQHHATAAIGPDGDALVAFRAGGWVVTVPLADGGTPGEGSLPFGEVAAHHPQVAVGLDGFLLVAVSGSGDLFARSVDGGGEPLGFGAGREPDVAPGLMVWGDDGGLGRSRFDGDLDRSTPLAPLATDGAVGTPVLRPRDGGFLLAWAERAPGSSRLVRLALDGAADPSGPREVVATWDLFDDDARPALAVGPSGDALAWRREEAGEAWLQLRDAGGDLLDEVPLHEGGPAGRPSLAAAGDTVWAAWERGTAADGWRLVLQRFDLGTGAALWAELDLGGTVGPGRPYVAVRERGDGTVQGLVTWESWIQGAGRRAVWARAFEGR